MLTTNAECFYDSPLPNRRLHEPENKEYSSLQAAKLKTKCVIDLYFSTNIHMMNRFDQKQKKIMREKRHGIGFETVAGMEGGYRRNTPK